MEKAVVAPHALRVRYLAAEEPAKVELEKEKDNEQETEPEHEYMVHLTAEMKAKMQKLEAWYRKFLDEEMLVIVEKTGQNISRLEVMDDGELERRLWYMVPDQNDPIAIKLRRWIEYRRARAAELSAKEKKGGDDDDEADEDEDLNSLPVGGPARDHEAVLDEKDIKMLRAYLNRQSTRIWMYQRDHTMIHEQRMRDLEILEEHLRMAKLRRESVWAAVGAAGALLKQVRAKTPAVNTFSGVRALVRTACGKRLAEDKMDSQFPALSKLRDAIAPKKAKALQYPIPKKSVMWCTQLNLPIRPLPKLTETSALLASQMALLGVEATCIEDWQTFFKSAFAEDLQYRLHKMRMDENVPNWFESFWEDGLTQYSGSLAFASSVGILMHPDPVAERNKLLPHAAHILHATLRFWEKCTKSTLPPTLDSHGCPECMRDFAFMFSQIHRPQADTISERVLQRSPFYIVVMLKGRLYKMTCTEPKGQPMSVSDLYLKLVAIYDHAGGLDFVGNPPAWFTADDRIEWADQMIDIRDSDPRVEHAMSVLEGALFVLCLDVDSNLSMNCVAPLLYGNAANRWFDMVLQLVVTDSGMWGLVFDRLMIDYPSACRLLRFILEDCQDNADEALPQMRDDEDEDKPGTSSSDETEIAEASPPAPMEVGDPSQPIAFPVQGSVLTRLYRVDRRLVEWTKKTELTTLYLEDFTSTLLATKGVLDADGFVILAALLTQWRLTIAQAQMQASACGETGPTEFHIPNVVMELPVKTFLNNRTDYVRPVTETLIDFLASVDAKHSICPHVTGRVSKGTLLKSRLEIGKLVRRYCEEVHQLKESCVLGQQSPWSHMFALQWVAAHASIADLTGRAPPSPSIIENVDLYVQPMPWFPGVCALVGGAYFPTAINLFFTLQPGCTQITISKGPFANRRSAVAFCKLLPKTMKELLDILSV